MIKPTLKIEIGLVPHGFSARFELRHNATGDNQGIETFDGCGSFREEIPEERFSGVVVDLAQRILKEIENTGKPDPLKAQLESAKKAQEYLHRYYFQIKAALQMVDKLADRTSSAPLMDLEILRELIEKNGKVAE